MLEPIVEHSAETLAGPRASHWTLEPAASSTSAGSRRRASLRFATSWPPTSPSFSGGHFAKEEIKIEVGPKTARPAESPPRSTAHGMARNVRTGKDDPGHPTPPLLIAVASSMPLAALNLPDDGAAAEQVFTQAITEAATTWFPIA
jgi:hypothetical protein